MNKMPVRWFYLFVKRLLCRKSFLAFLLLLPLLAFGIRLMGTNINRTNMLIGIVFDETDTLSKNAVDDLLKYDGTITFQVFENEKILKEEIENQSIQWGYVFADNIEQKLKQGQTPRLITCYQTPASFLAKLTDEIIFSSIMNQYGETILMDYVENSSLFHTTQKNAALLELPKAYANYQSGQETFSFEYKTIEGVSVEGELFAPVKGICSLLIYIAGIFGAMQCMDNNKKGIYKRLSQKGRAIGRFLAVLAPVCLMSASAFITMGLLGSGMIDILFLLGYCLAVSGFCFFLAMVFQNEALLGSTIPIITIGSIVCCPIFFDISSVFPIAKAVSWIFLPNYYLRNMLSLSICIGIAAILAGYFLSLRKA